MKKREREYLANKKKKSRPVKFVKQDFTKYYFEVEEALKVFNAKLLLT